MNPYKRQPQRQSTSSSSASSSSSSSSLSSRIHQCNDNYNNIHSNNKQQNQQLHGNKNIVVTTYPIQQYQTALQMKQIHDKLYNTIPPIHFLLSSSSSSSSSTSSSSIPSWLYLHMGIHEISGSGGTGKTQLACNMVVQAATAMMTTSLDIPITTIQDKTTTEHVTTTAPTTKTILTNTTNHTQSTTSSINPYKKNNETIIISRNNKRQRTTTIHKDSVVVDDEEEIPTTTIPQSILNSNINSENNNNNKIRAIYISLSSNGTIATQKIVYRLQQMIQLQYNQQLQQQQLKRKNQNQNNHTSDNIHQQQHQNNYVTTILHRIQIITCRTIDDFNDLLYNPNGLLVSSIYHKNNTTNNNHLRLIVIDNIADLFRYNIENEQQQQQNQQSIYTMERSKQFYTMTCQLQKFIQHRNTLSSFHNNNNSNNKTNFVTPLSIVILNQMTSSIQPEQQQQYPQQQQYNYKSQTTIDDQPALGLSWSNCMHSRYVLTKEYHYINDDDTTTATTTISDANTGNDTNQPTVTENGTNECNRTTTTRIGIVTRNDEALNGFDNATTLPQQQPQPSQQRRVLQRTISLTHSSRYPKQSMNFTITSAGCYLR